MEKEFRRMTPEEIAEWRKRIEKIIKEGAEKRRRDKKRPDQSVSTNLQG